MAEKDDFKTKITDLQKQNDELAKNLDEEKLDKAIYDMAVLHGFKGPPNVDKDEHKALDDAKNKPSDVQKFHQISLNKTKKKKKSSGKEFNDNDNDNDDSYYIVQNVLNEEGNNFEYSVEPKKPWFWTTFPGYFVRSILILAVIGIVLEFFGVYKEPVSEKNYTNLRPQAQPQRVMLVKNNPELGMSRAKIQNNDNANEISRGQKMNIRNNGNPEFSLNNNYSRTM